MRNSILFLALVFTAATACTGGSDKEAEDLDSDGDGLTDIEEADLGTDPNAADTDGDTLSDGDEVELGTDPTLIDTDEDSYQDNWEITEGTDPTDYDSRIYTGMWPYNPDKDSLDANSAWDGSAARGDIMPRVQWVDQFGDTVDTFDFAGHGKPIVLDISGVWCYWCHEMAKWHMDRNNALQDYYGDEEWYALIPKLVENGEIYWITAIDANSQGRAADQDDVDGWYEDYPNPHIPVLLDADAAIADWARITGYPSVIYLDEDFSVLRYNDYSMVFSRIASDYEDWVEPTE
jgi:hypothetical protein